MSEQMSSWQCAVRVDPSLLVSRARGDSPFVTFPVRCGEIGGECALPIGHLSDHISISDAWSSHATSWGPADGV